MFTLSGAMKFKYIPNYKDMHGGYDKLHGVVCTLAGKMEEGTAYENQGDRRNDVRWMMEDG